MWIIYILIVWFGVKIFLTDHISSVLMQYLGALMLLFAIIGLVLEINKILKK